jgi:hypothetical protein
MHFHSPCCAYNAPNEPLTTHKNCVYKKEVRAAVIKT